MKIAAHVFYKRQCCIFGCQNRIVCEERLIESAYRFNQFIESVKEVVKTRKWKQNSSGDWFCEEHRSDWRAKQ